MNEPAPFVTNNAMLAHALFALSFPMAVLNVYDDAALRRLGFRTIQEAKEKGRPGDLKFLFENSAELQRCVKAFNDTQEALKNGSIKTRRQQESDMQVACAVLKCGPKFRDAWKNFPAHFLERKEGQAETTETKVDGRTLKTTTMPGFVLVAEGVSKERAESLGL